MSNHTPGPWVARFDENGGYDCISDAISVRPYGEGYQPSIVYVDLGKNPSVTTEMKAWANSHLIAAAPELLAALTVLVDRHVELVSSGDCGNWNAEHEESVIAARSAISKAEGLSR